MWTDEQKPHAPADGTASLWLVRRCRPMHSLHRQCGYRYSPKGMLPSSVSKQPTGEQKKRQQRNQTYIPPDQNKNKCNTKKWTCMVWWDSWIYTIALILYRDTMWIWKRHFKMSHSFKQHIWLSTFLNSLIFPCDHWKPVFHLFTVFGYRFGLKQHTDQ